MMSAKSLFMLLPIIVIVTSCSKKSNSYDISNQNGVVVYSNKVNNNIVAINPIIEKEIICDSVSAIACYDIDSQGNAYIFDGKRMVFNKIDINGKLLKVFGKRGTGPGEYGAAGDFILFKNQIYVPDMMSKRLVIFNNNGDFIKVVDNITSIPTGVSVVNDNVMIGYCVLPIFKNDKIYLKSSLSILDSNIAEQKTLMSKEFLFDPQKMFDNNNESPVYTSFKNHILLATNSEDKYEILVIDTNGNLLKKILKAYKKINYSKDEIEQFQKKIDEKLRGQMPVGSIKFNKTSKLAINWLGYDKFKRLWVQSAREVNISKQGVKEFDIFDEDGVLLGQTSMKVDGDIKFRNNKIYSLDKNNNRLIVWTY